MRRREGSKKGGVIFHLITISNHISILKKKKKKKERLVEIWSIIQFLPWKHNSCWTISKPPRNQLKLHIQSTGGEIASYVKVGLILILFAWGFNLRFNSAAETLLLMNHKQTNLVSIETSYSIYWGCDRIVCQIWAYFNIVCLNFNSRFNSAVETLYLVNHNQITSESIENPYYVY